MNNDAKFPYVWKNEESNPKSLTDTLKDHYAEIKKKLLKDGAVLFRNFGIDNPESLEECVNAFPGTSVNYAGGNSPRTNIKGKVYTSTEHPAHLHISLHNEFSYASSWPKHIFFCCHTPAPKGGFTPIVSSKKIFEDLDAEIKEAFQEKGVRYIRNLHGGYGAGSSWQDTFETADKSVVEKHCKDNDILFEWNEDDGLRLIEKRHAIIRHPETKEQVWFNQADQFHPSTNTPDVFKALMEIYEDDPLEMPQYACYNDGTEIPLDTLDKIRAIVDKHTISFPWEKGDLLLLDNILVAHGRTPFEGPRKILVAMSS
jgi:Probable taurine catabolism dioxygenase